MVMGRIKIKKSKLETPQVRESRAAPGPEPFTDMQAHIQDPQYHFPISSIKHDIFRKHLENRDRFKVVFSGLYYQIAPPVYPVVELICWLRGAYNEH